MRSWEPRPHIEIPEWLLSVSGAESPAPQLLLDRCEGLLDETVAERVS